MLTSRIVSSHGWALAALLASISGGCASSEQPRVCTDIGCADGLQVAFSPNSGWQPGQYRFVIDVDGQVTTCEGSLPLRSCDAGPSLQCTPAGDRIGVGESGCALPPEQHGFSDLRVGGSPAQSVTVTVSRDGAELVKKTLAPEYKTSQPNGPGCEPVCHNASEALAIPGAAP